MQLVVYHVQLVMGMEEIKEPWVPDLTADETGELWGSEARDAMRSLVENVSVAATLPAIADCDAPHSNQDGSSVTSSHESKDETLLVF